LKINQYIDLFRNMGLRYVAFRVKYAMKTKIGTLAKKFPVNPEFKSFILLKQWKEITPPFFFQDKEAIKLAKHRSSYLKDSVKELKDGYFTFFSKLKFNLGKDYDWVTNPETGYQYDITKHFTEIQELSKEAGDIKYVWEKARFSFLYDIIRYDHHFDEDQSSFVFNQIEDFIDKNPLNQGPNYKCSQETSLRILNWTFALYYYKNSKYLTEAVFSKIMNAIYWQLHHVYHNINFSRIAVRNNHAITETLMLYLSNLLFPFIPETKKWGEKGKKWFEEEIAYQIYNDGTFLQFSMNYHRVVVQLLTWGIQLAKLNNDKFKEIVYLRAEKSLAFLDANLNIENGFLPNYGSNDGALFFKLTDDDYRNYKSQLDDLRAVLKNEIAYDTESYFWYGLDKPKKINLKLKEINEFSKGGYYLINDMNSKTFIKCGSYKDRPAQSDNLHLDIWINGVNYLRDSGSYKYNTKEEYIKYFNGCEGHNTISLSGKDQMLKGSRFIWFNWVKKSNASLLKKGNKFIFNGNIIAFKELGNQINHSREILKEEGKKTWKITDTVKNNKDNELIQYWHINPKYFENVKIETKNDNDEIIAPIIEKKWYSGYYGVKKESIRISFKSEPSTLYTTIEIQE